LRNSHSNFNSFFFLENAQRNVSAGAAYCDYYNQNEYGLDINDIHAYASYDLTRFADFNQRCSLLNGSFVSVTSNDDMNLFMSKEYMDNKDGNSPVWFCITKLPLITGKILFILFLLKK
jgi:hypothetical protein